MQKHPERVEALTANGARVDSVPAGNAGPASFVGPALERVAALDCNAVVVEGGPTLHRSFWDATLVDRVQVFLTPHVAGSGGLRWDVLPIGTLGRLHDQRHLVLGSDLLVEGYVHRTH